MIAAVSSSRTTIMTVEDMQRAQDWMLRAEQAMPDCFKDMVGKSDNAVLMELWQHVWEQHMKYKKPVHESKIWAFLKTRAPSERIGRIIDVAERSRIIARDAQDQHLYWPKPKSEWGLE